MYAVIRTGGKQYRVAPGDKLKIETLADNGGTIEFADVLAVSGQAGEFEGQLEGAKVLASVIGSGRGEKILVFKLKRKKQYKKMQGHRQNYVEVRINEIQVNGKTFNMDSVEAAAPAAKASKAGKKADKPVKSTAAKAPVDGSSVGVSQVDHSAIEAVHLDETQHAVEHIPPAPAQPSAAEQSFAEIASTDTPEQS